MAELVSLTDKRILVTGASSGIGRACAELAAELGASVALVARRADKLEEVRTGMKNPDKHLVLSCDVTDRSAIADMVQQAAAGARIDGFVHAAGVGPAMPLNLITEEHLRTVFDTNYFSFVEIMKNVTKFKIRGPKLSVVAISSIAALSGWSGVTAYCSSKGALTSCVRALAMEFACKGTRVNAVCPSNIKTPMYESVSVAMNDESSLKVLLEKQPLGLGEPRQVANVVAFLLSDASSFVTGVNLPVDGGYMAQ